MHFHVVSSLTSTEFQSTLTESSVFESCIDLINITIPSAGTNNYEYAFRYCSSLENITYQHIIKTIHLSMECYLIRMKQCCNMSRKEE